MGPRAILPTAPLDLLEEAAEELVQLLLGRDAEELGGQLDLVRLAEDAGLAGVADRGRPRTSRRRSRAACDPGRASCPPRGAGRHRGRRMRVVCRGRRSARLRGRIGFTASRLWPGVLQLTMTMVRPRRIQRPCRARAARPRSAPSAARGTEQARRVVARRGGRGVLGGGLRRDRGRGLGRVGGGRAGEADEAPRDLVFLVLRRSCPRALARRSARPSSPADRRARRRTGPSTAESDRAADPRERLAGGVLEDADERLTDRRPHDRPHRASGAPDQVAQEPVQLLLAGDLQQGAGELHLLDLVEHALDLRRLVAFGALESLAALERFTVRAELRRSISPQSSPRLLPRARPAPALSPAWSSSLRRRPHRVAGLALPARRCTSRTKRTARPPSGVSRVIRLVRARRENEADFGRRRPTDAPRRSVVRREDARTRRLRFAPSADEVAR